MAGKPIPFDSLVLMAVAQEAQALVGGYVQRIKQPDEHTVVLRIKGEGVSNLLLSCDPRFFRVHLTSSWQGDGDSHLLRRMREKLENTRLVEVRQNGFDRVIILGFQTPEGVWRLVVELMGTRANLILLDAEGRMNAAMRKIGNLRDGQEYLPPEPPAPDFETAIREGRGLSPFLRREVELRGADAMLAAEWQPVHIEGLGAYPFPPRQVEPGDSKRLQTTPNPMSAALEQHYSDASGRADLLHGVSGLIGQLERALDARSSAARQMESVLDTAGRARHLQMQAELILAHASTIPEGASVMETADYEGNPLEIKLNPEKTPIENAQRLFDKAKKAKNAAAGVGQRLRGVRADVNDLEGTIAAARALLEDPDPKAAQDKLAPLKQLAVGRGWLREQRPMQAEAADRPYEGHRIRETVCPRGFKVIWSENATGNDYLVSRIAKPNDYWFHARGATGAHVILQTGNKPERIQLDSLAFAALLAARHSSQKHASHVPVDYTLAKYVRKPRKSAPGAVTYSREKTLFVEPARG